MIKTIKKQQFPEVTIFFQDMDEGKKFYEKLKKDIYKGKIKAEAIINYINGAAMVSNIPKTMNKK